MTKHAPILPGYSHYHVTRTNQTHELHLHEILGALSHAIDMTEGQPRGHAVRCCWIGMQIGIQMGLPDDTLADLYYTVLMKDLGCSSNAARICALFLTDDIAFKRDHKKADAHNFSDVLRFVVTKIGTEAGLAERIRAMVGLLHKKNEISREMFQTRCHQGANIAAKLRFPQAVQDGIRNLDERWDGKGEPEGHRGTAIPLISQIALLSQVVDVFY